MEPADRIKTINELNAIGIRLARVPTLEQALRLHAIAAEIATNPEISADYRCVSIANQAYASRQLGGLKGYLEAANLLEHTLERTEPRELPRTYAGRGRIYEELGIVTADMPLLPGDAALQTTCIKRGLSFFEQAIQDYDAALTNSGEIYTTAQLTQRRLRTIGMRAPKARDLYELVAEEQEKKEWIGKAVDYATEEVTAREALGETQGQNLANAYHTLGVALTEMVVDTPDNYIRAKILFDRVADTPGVHANTLRTIVLRRAWLEYRRNPAAKEAIIPLFDAFLADTTALTGADRNGLNKQVLELGRHLGEEYVEKVKGF